MQAMVLGVLVIGALSARDSLNMATVGYWSFGEARAVAVDTIRNVYFLGVGGSVVGYWYAPNLTRIVDLSFPYDQVTGLHYDAGSQRLYISAGPLITVDFTRLDSPVVQSVYWTPGRVFDATSRGDTVFLVDGDSVRILDMTDPAAPQEIAAIGGRWLIDPPYVDVEIWGNALYYASAKWVKVVDVTDPASPVFTDSLSHFGQRIRVSGGWLYVAGLGLLGTGLRGLDLSDPFHPVAAWQVTDLFYMTSLDVQESLLVVSMNGAPPYNGVRVYRVNGSSPPTLLGSVTVQWAMDVRIHGTAAYLAASTLGLVAVNLADPSAPFVADQTDDAPGPLFSLRRVGNLLYMGTLAGLYIMDVSQPQAPALVGVLRDSLVFNVRDVEVVGSYAYLAQGGRGLGVVNVTNPAQPVVETVLNFGSGQAIRRAVAHGNALYVSDVYWDTLHVLDLSIPSAPARDTVFPGKWTGLGLDPGRNLLYGAGGNGVTGVLAVWDVSVPLQPVLLNSVSGIGGNGLAVDGDGNLAYYAGQSHGIVLDVSDPAAPAMTWAYNPTTTGVVEVYEAYGRGHLGFFVQTDGRLRVFDASDSTAPVEVGYYLFSHPSFPRGSEFPDDLEMDSIWVFVARRGWGLQVLEFPLLLVGEDAGGMRPALRLRRMGREVVVFTPREGGRYRVQVLDLLGRRRVDRWLHDRGEGRIRLTLPLLSPGVYLFRVEGEGAVLQQKWVVP